MACYLPWSPRPIRASPVALCLKHRPQPPPPSSALTMRKLQALAPHFGPAQHYVNHSRPSAKHRGIEHLAVTPSRVTITRATCSALHPPSPSNPYFPCTLVFLEQGVTSTVVYRFVENLLCSPHPPPPPPFVLWQSGVCVDHDWRCELVGGIGFYLTDALMIGATCMLCLMCVCQCEFGFVWCPEGPAGLLESDHYVPWHFWHTFLCD